MYPASSSLRRSATRLAWSKPHRLATAAEAKLPGSVRMIARVPMRWSLMRSQTSFTAAVATPWPRAHGVHRVCEVDVTGVGHVLGIWVEVDVTSEAIVEPYAEAALPTPLASVFGQHRKVAAGRAFGRSDFGQPTDRFGVLASVVLCDMRFVKYAQPDHRLKVPANGTR